uniref:Lamina-associated polypeptide 2 alpha C-terminal domain-containing protein n=1 Tax=Xenopus tropicalis TaxID=8364 RepID=A0A803JVY2_XENTR
MSAPDDDLLSLIEEIDLPDRPKKLKAKIKKQIKTVHKPKGNSPSPIKESVSEPAQMTTTALVHATQEGQSQSLDPSIEANAATSQTPSTSDLSQLISWIQSTVHTSVQQALSAPSLPQHSKRKRKRSPSPATRRKRSPSPSPQQDSDSQSYHSSEEISIIDSDEEFSSEGQSSGSDGTSRQPEEVKNILKDIFATLEIKEEQVALSKADKVLGNTSKKARTFPVCKSITNSVESEWHLPDRKSSLPHTFFSMYPIPEEYKHWEKVPKVDPPIVRLARNTTLPAEDAGYLKDPMDKKIDAALKRDFQNTTAILRPAAAASATVAKTAKYWCQELQRHPPTNPDQFAAELEKIKSALTFLGEAALETAKLSARASAASVTARRALWLRQWSGDTASKHKLTSLKFSGSQLFGPELKQIISEVTGGKGAFLPHGKRPRKDFHRRNYHHRTWSSNNRQQRSSRPQPQPQTNRRFKPSWQNQPKMPRKNMPTKGQDS